MPVKEAVIVSGVRTPVGRHMGALKEVQAYDLAALVLNEALKRAKLRAEWVDEVVLGQSYQSGEYVNIARMALLKAGWPESIPGITLDRRCCTGLDTVCFAAMMIQSGHADVVVAGGVESMSNAEFYIPGEIKWGIGGKKGVPLVTLLYEMRRRHARYALECICGGGGLGIAALLERRP